MTRERYTLTGPCLEYLILLKSPDHCRKSAQRGGTGTLTARRAHGAGNCVPGSEGGATEPQAQRFSAERVGCVEGGVSGQESSAAGAWGGETPQEVGRKVKGQRGQRTCSPQRRVASPIRFRSAAAMRVPCRRRLQCPPAQLQAQRRMVSFADWVGGMKVRRRMSGHSRTTLAFSP